jgi:hypothetical protein
MHNIIGMKSFSPQLLLGEIPKTPVKSLFFKNIDDPTIDRNPFYYCTISSFKITKNYLHLYKITITLTNSAAPLQKQSETLQYHMSTPAMPVFHGLHGTPYSINDEN